MRDRIKIFIEQLALTEVTPNVCNQYSYEAKENEIRRDNLQIYLEKMQQISPKVLLVGEAPGYRGCRLTGVPFTSEHLLMHSMKGLGLFGQQQGYRLAEEKDKLLKEATATIIWETLMKNNMLALGWNSFPFHPHKADDPNSNRAPLKKELLLGQSSLANIIDMFNIKNIVAVGSKAEETLKIMDIPCHKVRHPAQGGKNEFVAGIEGIRDIIGRI